MAATMRIAALALATLAIGLMNMAPGCGTAVPPDDGSDTQTDGSTPSLPDEPPPTDGSPDTGTDPAAPEPNPNSPCENQTDIYVSYVNQSSARVVFVENFRDEANKALSSSILSLQVTGTSGDVRHRCITCPYQAGIRNIRYIRDGVTTAVPYPQDLFRGTFQCGDHITFVFTDNGSVETSVETP